MLNSKEIEEYEKIEDLRKQTLFVASRWAVKESVFKALQMKDLQFPEICIVRSENGKPDIFFEGESAKFVRSMKIRETFVSLSHDSEYTVAFVTLMSEDQ